MRRVIFLTLMVVAVSAGGISTGMDNEICSAAPNYYQGDSASNYAGYWTYPTNECRKLLWFDVDPTIERGYITLTLYRRTEGNTYSFYEITEEWGPYVTWATQPTIGKKVGEFVITEDAEYVIEVPHVFDYGWMIKNDLGETPPCEIFSFESDTPPKLDFINPGKDVGIAPVSLGAIKAAYR